MWEKKIKTENENCIPETASGKNVIEHPPVFIFTTCASSVSIYEKIERS